MPELITKIKSTLQQAQQRYKAIFEQAAVGIAVLAMDGQFLDINQKLCEILGYSRSELIRLTFEEITYPDDLNASFAFIATILNDKTDNYIMDKRYLHKNGSIVWGRLMLSLAYSSAGVPENFIAIIQDIQHYKQMESALKNQERRAQAVLDASLDGFLVVAIQDGTLVEVNDIYCHLSGYSREELLTMHVYDLDSEETIGEAMAHMQRVMQRGGDVFKTRHRRKDGGLWPVEVTVTYSDVDGGCFFVFLRDIRKRYTNKALLNLQLHLSDLLPKGSITTLFQTAVDQAEALTDSQIGFFHLVESDQQHISLQVWSTNTTQMFCSAHGMSGHYPIAEAGVWVDCIHQGCPVIHNDYAALAHKKGLPEGHPQVLRELVVPVFRRGIVVAVLGVGNKAVDYTKADTKLVRKIGNMVYDYIERKQADARIEFMAYYDALTSLPNRTLLRDRLAQAMVQAERSSNLLAIAYLDLDGFKPVNDRYGHGVGDEFLSAFAQRITKTLRAGDTLARLGGDEFALILPNLTHVYDGEVILWRLLEILAEPFCISAHEIRVGASIGFTVYPLDESSSDTLLRHADQAMYQAKWHGKNTVRIYDTTQNAHLQLQQETVDELRQALANNELALYYQPRIELSSGQVLGLEASMRWHHPQRGVLLADEFVPALHGTIKTARLDKWAITQALTQIATWNKDGYTLPVSVNISNNSLDKPEFLEFMRDQVACWHPTVAALLEIDMLTPTATIDLDLLAQVMDGCKQLGISFAIDNYDPNYTPLNAIRHIPIQHLKLDPQFVRSVSQSAANLKLLEETIIAATKLPLSVIAQGIDNLNLAALLIDLGCPQGQGAGLAQPMPAESIVEWCRAWPLNSRCKNLHDLSSGDNRNALLQVAIHAVQHWCNDVTQFVETRGKTVCPMLCTDQCPMSHWYNGLGLLRYGNRPGFAFQSARHRTLHLQASNIAELVESGFTDQALTNLAQFQGQCDELVDMLTRLSNLSS